MKSQNHSSLSSYAPPSEPLGLSEDESLGAADIFSMCSLICFIPWRSFLVKNDSQLEEQNSLPSEGPQFQVISTTEDKPDADTETEISMPVSKKISKSEEDLALYDSIPAWKRKYIARKGASAGAGVDNSSSSTLSSSHRQAPSSSSSSGRRTTLEETLDRCRNIEDTSISLHDLKDEDDEEAGSGLGELEVGEASALSSWVSYLTLGSVGQAAPSSSSSSTSLYSMVLGTTDPDGDKIDSSLNSVSVTSSSSSASSFSSENSSSSYSYSHTNYDSKSPAYQRDKWHRRQQSPSGVMDLVVESE